MTYEAVARSERPGARSPFGQLRLVPPESTRTVGTGWSGAYREVRRRPWGTSFQIKFLLSPAQEANARALEIWKALTPPLSPSLPSRTGTLNLASHLEQRVGGLQQRLQDEELASVLAEAHRRRQLMQLLMESDWLALDILEALAAADNAPISALAKALSRETDELSVAIAGLVKLGAVETLGKGFAPTAEGREIAANLAQLVG